MSKKIFYEEKEVVKFTETGQKTPLGEPVLNVEFKKADPMVMTALRFNTMKTDVVSDASKARDVLLQEITRKFYAMMIEYGVKVIEVDALFTTLIKLTNDSQSQANCALWGLNHEFDRTLFDVNEVLMKKYGKPEEPRKDNNEVAPERSGADKQD